MKITDGYTGIKEVSNAGDRDTKLIFTLTRIACFAQQHLDDPCDTTVEQSLIDELKILEMYNTPPVFYLDKELS